MAKLIRILSWIVVIYVIFTVLVFFLSPVLFCSGVSSEFCGSHIFILFPWLYFVFDLLENIYSTYILSAALILAVGGSWLFGYLCKRKNVKFFVISYLGSFFFLMAVFTAIGYQFRYAGMSLDETHRIGLEAGRDGSLDKCMTIKDKRGNVWQERLRNDCIETAITTTGNRSLCNEYDNEYSKNYCLEFLKEAYQLSSSKFCSSYPKNSEGYSYECLYDKCSSAALNMSRVAFQDCYYHNAFSDHDPEWCDLKSSYVEVCKEHALQQYP